MTQTSAKIQKILITGGTGLVGMRLSELLTENGYIVSHLSRSKKTGEYQTFLWNIDENYVEKEAIQSVDAIIHLAGSGIADKKWTESYKKSIYDSRINSTRLLREKVSEFNPNLKHFISASAIGIYGWNTKDEWMFESSNEGDGFLANVVKDWEKETNKFDEIGVKNSCLRIGVVLSEKGGALEKMAQPIKFGFGAPLGSGKQYLSWVHIEDLCRMFQFVLEQNQSQILNAVSPNPMTNKAFTKAIAKQLKRPLWLPNVPSFVLKIILGEMSNMILGGNRVSSNKIQGLGFKFLYSSVEKALQNLLE